DYPVIMGATLVIGTCVIVVNLLTDISAPLRMEIVSWLVPMCSRVVLVKTQDKPIALFRRIQA
ncbi:hypothetical protein ACC693_39085, partial [Rhizobium ruizarguesonis]